MNKVLKSKSELMLAVIGVFLLAALVTILSWGIGFLAVNLGKAISSGVGKGAGTNFDLNGAKQLNLKGLVQ